jgi:hypothetical protein
MIAGVAVGVACIPVKSLDCPAWDVWVTDQKGQPVHGVTVVVRWRNYSAERRSHETDAITDAQGHVAFGAQTISASLVQRAVATLSSAMAGFHSSFGPHATVYAFSESLEGFASDDQRFVVDWTGKPDHMESRIIVTPRKL